MKKPEKSSLEAFVAERNRSKVLFTPGPASLLTENLTGLRPCFGRGDEDYGKVERKVLDGLRNISGLEYIVPMQGSASLALELTAHNFLFGKVLVVSTGYYSDRLETLARMASEMSASISNIEIVDWQGLSSIAGEFDWIVACSVETSIGLNIPIKELAETAGRLNARLMLDATASIGLESGHELADVICFSSCKGLFGLTGAAFVAFNNKPDNKVNSFYLNLENHLNKKMTGPYHAICSLLNVLPVHSELKEAVIINKKLFSNKMKNLIVHDETNQPQICTYITETLYTDNETTVLYQSRGKSGGQVVSHLGEVHLGSKAKGEILNNLRLEER